ncbi:MAG: 4-(cytidine 5'-diphospho)-2-C-methyl-D-erythritol kinase [Clostridia bacterium]|nr:4-(cytidine 5'-diphospho)-2-C-methyl-D-erythritol kinase [Clostridia bacterium]
MLLVKARAKINWTLDVTGRRPDGYHWMDMLMSSVELHDTLFLEEAEKISLAVAGKPGEIFDVPVDENNLVLRAAQSLRQAFGETRGAAIRLVKRIPVGAGLGGGSADAAAAIIGLCQLWEMNPSVEKKNALGLSIGADVPFLLTGGLARVSGIGEVLEPLTAPEPIWLVVVQPCGGLSTREVFKTYGHGPAGGTRRPDGPEAQSALAARDLPRLALAMGNVLEPVGIAMQPLIGNAITELLNYGAVRAMMTGSGSAVFGVFECESKARAAGERLRGRWKRTIVTQTAREGCTWDRLG